VRARWRLATALTSTLICLPGCDISPSIVDAGVPPDPLPAVTWLFDGQGQRPSAVAVAGPWLLVATGDGLGDGWEGVLGVLGESVTRIADGEPRQFARTSDGVAWVAGGKLVRWVGDDLEVCTDFGDGMSGLVFQVGDRLVSLRLPPNDLADFIVLSFVGPGCVPESEAYLLSLAHGWSPLGTERIILGTRVTTGIEWRAYASATTYVVFDTDEDGQAMILGDGHVMCRARNGDDPMRCTNETGRTVILPRSTWVKRIDGDWVYHLGFAGDELWRHRVSDGEAQLLFVAPGRRQIADVWIEGDDAYVAAGDLVGRLTLPSPEAGREHPEGVPRDQSR
jgi:hypothetical protein